MKSNAQILPIKSTHSIQALPLRRAEGVYISVKVPVSELIQRFA